MHVIYQIRNLINDKIYIGSAVDDQKRWIDHKNLLQKNKHPNQHPQNSWNKYTEENFIFEIIEEVTEKEILLEREQYYFDILNPGYNICKVAGSRLGTKHSGETLQLMSEIKMGDKNPMYGKKLSEETKKKLSESKRGGKHWNFGKILSKKSRNKISDTLKGSKLSEKTKDRLSLKFKRKKMYKNHNKKIHILQFNSNKNLIKKWNSKYEIQKELGFHRCGITNSCNKGNSYKGFYWSYVNNFS